MRAGQLRHFVLLQRPGGTRDPATGERTTTWTTVTNGFASIEPLSGREEFLAAQRQASSTHQITLRYSPTLAAMDASWRVLYGPRVFTIDAPPRNVEERGREILLMCTEGLRKE